MNESTTDTPTVSAEEILALMPPDYVHVAREAVLLDLPDEWKVTVTGDVVHLYSPKRITLPSANGDIEVPVHVARFHYQPSRETLSYENEPLGEYVRREARWIHVTRLTEPITALPTLQAAVDAVLAEVA